MKVKVVFWFFLSVMPFITIRALEPNEDYQLYLDSAAIHSAEGRYREASNYYQKGLAAYKEYYKNKLESINEELVAEYEIDKKEQEYKTLNKTLELRRTLVTLFTILIIVLLVAVALLFLFRKYKLRAIKQREQSKKNETNRLKLEKEKLELEVQLKTLQAEKYQKELLADAMLVEYKNRALEELRQFIDNHPQLDKYHLRFESIMTDEANIQPGFYTRLQKHADNKLTSLDLKYCRMIYLKMTSKQMADILQVDPQTIRVSKYRLKLKLGLNKEDDLADFIGRIA